VRRPDNPDPRRGRVGRFPFARRRDHTRRRPLPRNLETVAYLSWNWKFESTSLQQRVCKLSVPADIAIPRTARHGRRTAPCARLDRRHDAALGDVYPSRRLVPTKVRAMIEFVASEFGRDPLLSERGFGHAVLSNSRTLAHGSG
jgi:hypothetical protein